ncbi:MAG: hypothetical protein GTN82_32220 [Candidatus Aminicenantes bacterium]|nr:hypothetical protein [Candidatus Aminicenantes bacterium]
MRRVFVTVLKCEIEREAAIILNKNLYLASKLKADFSFVSLIFFTGRKNFFVIELSMEQ